MHEQDRVKFSVGVAIAAVVLASVAVPAFASTVNSQPGHPHAGAIGATGPTGSTGPAPQGKAYGYYCRNESKQRVPGEKGTPFSQCVTAMAKLKSGKAGTPAAACASLSKKHSAGQAGTPFSRCVSDGAKLQKDQHG